MNMKKLTSLALVLVMVMALLAGCACKHEWKDADCKNPKTCELCGETEGEKTDEHEWEEATTEAPKTCKTCGKTEGEKINVDERFQTSACKDLFGAWSGTVTMTGADMGMPNITEDMSVTMTYTFSNDGQMTGSMKLQDASAFKAMMEDTLYAQFTAQGMSKEQADAAMQQAYGMGVKEYAETMAETLVKTMESMDVSMVYYVADGKIYAGLNWSLPMEPAEFSIENGVLRMEENGQMVEFTKQ